MYFCAGILSYFTYIITQRRREFKTVLTSNYWVSNRFAHSPLSNPSGSVTMEIPRMFYFQVFKQLQIKRVNRAGDSELVSAGAAATKTTVLGPNQIQVQVDNITAEEIVLNLEFKDKWILISEVEFKTEPVDQPQTTEKPPTKVGTEQPKPSVNTAESNKTEESRVENEPVVSEDITDLRQDMPGSDTPEGRERNSFPVCTDSVYILGDISNHLCLSPIHSTTTIWEIFSKCRLTIYIRGKGF